MPVHLSARLPVPVVRFQKLRNLCRSWHRHKTPSIDPRKQVILFAKPGGGVYIKNGCITANGNGRKCSKNKTFANRKGRPRGSKNKLSLNNSFNNQCEKKLFVYSFTNSAKCKACDRTFDGNLLSQCLKNHKTACPICGRTCKPPLTAHIKSHGTRPVSLTVACYECYECKEKFGNATIMAEHILDKHVDKSAPTRDVKYCSVCYSTRFPKSMSNHVSKVNSDPADIIDFLDRCEYCDKPSDLVTHPKEKHVQTSVDELECALCSVKFKTQTAIADHLVYVHCPRKTFSRPAIYRCRVCQAGFKSQINVLRHACNKIKSPHCEKCDKTFPSKMRYAFHLQFHEHPKYVSMHLHCDMCLAEFEDEYHLYDHIRFRHELHDKAVCEICGRTFKSSMGLNIHRRYHNGSRNFTCKSCNKSFLNKSTLREHEISHMDVKPFQCHICGQYLSRASRLRSHVKTHKAAESTNQKCYYCGACGFVAPNFVLLVEHTNKEHGDGHLAIEVELSLVVKCEFCDSTYMNATYLNDHRNTVHSNRDNSEAFICVICSSTFSTYSRLTTHKLTHGINMESTLATSESSEDPNKFNIPQFFSCQYCAKMCLHYTYFCLHRRLKHSPGIRTFPCDRCLIDFKTSWKLSYHKKTVHDQPPLEKSSEKYSCTVCSRKFIKIGALNLHKTRTHIDVIGDICKYLCHLCGKFFSSECSLKNHTKMHENGGSGGITIGEQHKNMTTVTMWNRRKTYRKPAVAIKPVARIFETRTIDEKPEFIELVDSHAPRSITGGVPCTTVCELCDENVDSLLQLRSHLENHVISGEAYLCKTCYLPFLSTTAFNVHGCSTETHAPPEVRFLGTPETGSSDTRPLVVDCSQIFKGQMTPSKVPEIIGKNSGKLSSSKTTNKDLEISVLDELFTVLSTPSTTSQTYSVDCDPPDDIDNIFNSIFV